jgi:hypothetical protein
LTALIRPATPADRDFIVSTWSSSFRTSVYAGLLSMETYADVQHREVKRVLDHPTTLTLVAAEPDELDERGRQFLYGFIALRQHVERVPPYVYYVYVKTAYRRGRAQFGLELGYAAQLFRAARIDPRRPFGYACQTSMSLQLASKIPLGAWDPLPARYLEHS